MTGRRPTTRSRWRSSPSAALAARDADWEERWSSVTPGRHLHLHLHLGHDRAAEGLRDLPRQLPVDARHGPRRRRDRRRRAHLPLPAARPLLRAADPARQLRPRRDARLLGARPAEDHPQPRRGQADLLPVGAADLREDLHGRHRERPRRRAGSRRRSSTGRSASASRCARPSARAGQPGFLLRAQYEFADKQVLSKIRGLFGGRLKLAVTGAAPINPEILRFFDAAGVLVLEGWGMTETSTAATISTPEDFKFGTIGKPFPGCEVKIADDGEILVKGPNVFQGYYKNEEATARDDRRRLAPHRRHRRDRRGRLPSRSPAARRTSSSPPAARTSPRRTSRPRSSSTRWSPSAW